MLISFSLPESQFIAETPEAVTQKIRMYAALGLYQSGELSIVRQVNWQVWIVMNSSIFASTKA
jgi:hypothetical protein